MQWLRLLALISADGIQFLAKVAVFSKSCVCARACVRECVRVFSINTFATIISSEFFLS